MDQKLLYYLMLMTVSVDKNKDLGKWFLDTLGKKFRVDFLGYAHWFMSIRIYKMRDHSISMEYAPYRKK